MGITSNCAKFLFYAKQQGVLFDKTLMLGRQQLYVSSFELDQLLKQFRLHKNITMSDGFAEPLFEALGAEVIDSVDYSDYEKATIIHDLNKPIASILRNKYSLVFDGGTLEHVFNFPVAIGNCMDAIRIGGHFVTITPTNNQCGHGFYQFSPEIFFSLFSPKHGFIVKSIFLGVDLPGTGIREWYQVANPDEVKQRVTFSNNLPAYLMVLAEKTGEFSGELAPYQSDYQLVWNVYDSIHQDKQLENESRYLHWYRKYMPEFLKTMVRFMKRGTTGNRSVQNFGNINPRFFKKINI